MCFFFFQAEDGIRDLTVTGVQTCALPIFGDGVGCESCHGGAVDWLGIHVSGKSDHVANVKAGMYPLEEPVARAKIGRASCRERGEISVGAVSLKKKKTEKRRTKSDRKKKG